MSETFPYRGNLTWLRPGLIYLMTAGSHAYGLNTPTSDVDIKGIAVPPREYFLGFANSFEQAESKDPDMCVFDIRKFFRLAAECNPNIIEMLWCDESEHRCVTQPGRWLIDARERSSSTTNQTSKACVSTWRIRPPSGRGRTICGKASRSTSPSSTRTSP
jgi:hypothetical protein